MANATASQVQQLYLGYLGRPAESAGLNYWTTQDVSTLLASLSAQPEYQALYPNNDRATIVKTVYSNLFDRNPTQDEVNYWAYTSQTPTNNLISAFLAGAGTTDSATVAAKATAAQQVSDLYGSAGTKAQVQALFASIKTTADASQSLSTSLAAAYASTAANAIAAAQQNTSGSTTTFHAFSNTSLSVNSDNLASAVTGIAYDSSTGVTVTGLTVTGAPKALTIADSASSVTTLTLDVDNTGSTPVGQTVTETLSGFSKLVTLDASGSTANLTLNVTTSGASADALTTVNGGSGNDTITVSTAVGTGTVANAKALTVNSGAGDDVVTATVKDANLTINAGDGADKINLAFTTSTGGNHSATVTLGNGADTLALTSGNLLGFSSSAADATNIANIASSLVKVTDFSTNDTLVFGGATAFTASKVTTIADSALANATTITAALNIAAAALANGSNSSTANSAVFHFSGNTYVFHDSGAAVGGNGAVQGSVDATDNLVQLTGVQSLTDVAAHVNA